MGTLTANRQTTCKFERTLKAIEADEQYDTNDAHRIRLYRNRDLPASVIGRELRGAGFNVSTTRIKEHFIGDCNCAVTD